MALETGTYISDLVSTNPTSNDPKSQGDDHIRLLKSTVKATFPNVTNAVTPTHTELNYVDGVTGAIQTQLNAKAPLDSPALTGVPTTPTAATGTSGGQIASLDYVIATSLSASLPGQTGNAGKLLSTDGVDANWYDTIDGSVVSLLSGGDLVGTTGTQSLSNKSLTVPIIQDSADTTKKANFILSSVTAGQNRNITIANENMTLFTPRYKLLSTIVASDSATVDFEGLFTTDHDNYLITIDGVSQDSGSGVDFSMRFKKAGAYITSTTYSRLSSAAAVISGISSIAILPNVTTDTTKGQVYCEVVITRPTEDKKHMVSINAVASGGLIAGSLGGQNTTEGALEGIRFFFVSDNIKTGTFRLFGARKT